MAMLDDCPDAVLSDIICRLHHPRQLASVSFTCRRLRDLVHPVLQECKRYQFVNFGCISRYGIPAAPLRSILKNPTLSFYVTKAELRFTGDRNYEDDSTPVLSEFEELQLFGRAVKDFGVLDWEEWISFVTALSKGNQGARAALLLLIHPNLEDLHIVFGHDDHWINRIIQKIHSPSQALSCSAFHALRYLSFIETRKVYRILSRGFSCGYSLTSLLPFFLLPSIETISCSNVSQDEELEWNGEDGISTVTRLYFEYSYIRDEALEVLLRLPKALKYFSYEFGGPHAELSDFHQEEIVDIVTRTQTGLALENIHLGVLEEEL